MPKKTTREATNSATPAKIVQVVALLKRSEGASLAEIIAITGWQPHSARAALTGLRKKGHLIERSKRDDTGCWRIVETA
jgi:DNA-binding MarR family transcriptional regulator